MIGQEIDRRELLLIQLTDMQYGRNEIEFKRGQFRAPGRNPRRCTPPMSSMPIRVEFFGDEIQRIELIHPVTGATTGPVKPGPSSSPPCTTSCLEEQLEDAAVTTIKD